MLSFPFVGGVLSAAGEEGKFMGAGEGEGGEGQ